MSTATDRHMTLVRNTLNYFNQTIKLSDSRLNPSAQNTKSQRDIFKRNYTPFLLNEYKEVNRYPRSQKFLDAGKSFCENLPKAG